MTTESNKNDPYLDFERLKKRLQETQLLAQKLDAAIEQERREWAKAKQNRKVTA